MPDDVDEEEDAMETEDADGNKVKAKKVDKGEAFRREMAQVQFRNFVHEQQFYSWQFRSGRLYGRGEATKEEKGEGSQDGSSGQEANQAAAT